MPTCTIRLLLHITLVFTPTLALLNVPEQIITIDLSTSDQENRTQTVFTTKVNLSLGDVIIDVTNATSNNGFFVVQAHSFQYNVSLSKTTDLKPGTYVHGSNVGLVESPLATNTLYRFYLNCFETANVEVLLAVVVYRETEQEPLPKETADYELVQSNNSNDLQVVDDLGTLQTGPSQPILEKYRSTKVGTQNRSFSSKYFKQYIWVEYSVHKDAAFCFCCRLFGKDDKTESVFTKTGFTNWKKIAEKLSKHCESKTHIQNTQKYVAYKDSLKAGSVLTQMSSAYKEKILQNREYFKIITDILLTLCRQGVALRGHDESEDSMSKGNFKEICELVSRYNPQFKEQHAKYFNLTSSDIQNEIISISGNMILNIIVDEIKGCGMYAVMVDEARSFKEQQLSICVRYVKGFEIKERFLGFKNCSQERDATNLCNILVNYLQNLGLKDIPIIAQAYDGASVMSGRVGGLQAKIREKHPSAIYIHCMAHRLNLVVTDLCGEIESTKDCFHTLEALYVHFSSPGNHNVLTKIQKELGLSKIELNRLSDTRWSCRSSTCKAVKKSYSAIIDALQFEIQQNSNKNAVEAVGLLSNMKTSKFLVNLLIMDDILTMINILSKHLQSNNGTLAESTNIINGTIESLKQKRDEKVFVKLWLEIEDLAKKNDIGLDIQSSKRKKTENVRLKEFVVEASTSAIDEFKDTLVQSRTESAAQRFWLTTVYYPALDYITNHMKIRFSTESQKLAVAVQNFLQMNFDNSLEFIQHYADTFLINKEVLKAEMTVIKNCVGKRDGYINTSDIISVARKETFPNAYRFIQLALTLPISSASCERSFSTMRRIKNWLRSTVGQDRFSSLAIANIESDITKSLILDDVLEEFIKIGNRKLLLQ